jgi:hypothetical protein
MVLVPAGIFEIGCFGGPGCPKNHYKVWWAKPPLLLAWGCRGRPNPQKRRFPAGPKTIQQKNKVYGFIKGLLKPY